MFSEYFDLYISTSELVDYDDPNQPMRILLSPSSISPNLNYEPSMISDNLFYLTSTFLDTGKLFIEFQGRDLVQNYGRSTDSVYYQILNFLQILNIFRWMKIIFLVHFQITFLTIPN